MKRGQVYWCQFGENIGSEQCLTRPALILQNDSANRSSPNTVVAPITNTADLNSSVFPLNRPTSSPIQGNVLLGNMVTVSKVRLKDHICDLDEKTEMPGVEEALYNALGVIGKIEQERKKLSNIEDHLNRAKRERNEAQDALAEMRESLNLPKGTDYAAILEYVKKLKEETEEKT
ncbi:type II toxin-antitoxin system PemK/MazF family toxin [Virgibacillus litoralis]|uniref:mRNA interferase MazF n=1 Tax=Virgibacillus litoralis TaxID=578221 RepID=A0ABS4HGU3_9BACI|nr:mRNA interferase MazF [Virgibacillus litoralis]